jgi:MoxR-like ATPase
MTSIKIWSEKIKKHISQRFLGHQDKVDLVLAALLSGGHVLIEDFPGTGKTLLAKEFATLAGGDFKQIQCTPDLLPSDVLGVSVYNEEKQKFLFRRGPVITNFLLVDEINRATPRTQSALLEAMAESQVTVEGKSMALPKPFFLIATESPVDSEGTFPLPEVQKDRFILSLSLGYPEGYHEALIMKGQFRKKNTQPVTSPEEIQEARTLVSQVYCSDAVKSYILKIIQATRDNQSLMLGVSPRGTLALYNVSQALAALEGRDYVIPEDVKKAAWPVLSKRLHFKPDRFGKNSSGQDFLNNILQGIEVPPLEKLSPA